MSDFIITLHLTPFELGVVATLAAVAGLWAVWRLGRVVVVIIALRSL